MPSPGSNDRGIFAGLCPLCGARSAGSYCHAHSWAAGEGTPRRRPVRPAESPRVVSPPTLPAPLELVAGPSTGSGRRLVRRTA